MAIEAKRGCGYRRTGGIYMVSSGLGEPCHKLPIPLDVCPCCHGGIKPTRGFTWVGPTLVGPACSDVVAEARAETRDEQNLLDRERGESFAVVQRRYIQHCLRCPVCSPELLGDRAGLLWIGGSFYQTPAHFTEEARVQGVSRRIPALPRGFEVGRHFVLCAHREAIVRVEDGKKQAGIFHVFRPERIELIVRQSEATEEKIAAEAARGVTVVAVPDGDPDHDPGYKPPRKIRRRKPVAVDGTAPVSQLDLFGGEVRS